MRRTRIEVYARAKSSADVPGAMAVCAESFVLDTPAFGIASRNAALAQIRGAAQVA